MVKSSKSRGGKQPRRSQFSKDVEQNLRASERQRKANERARIRRDKERERQDKRRAKQYLKDLRQLEKFGFYEPKSHEITRYRKTRINKAMREYSELMSGSYFFIPVSKEQKTKGIKRASDLHMITSRKGIFLEKRGFETARLRKSRFSPKDELEIVLRNKIRRGENKGKTIDEIIPLATIDELVREESRFRRAANAFGPLNPNERLAFIIDADGDYPGYSYSVYDDIDLLIKALRERYIRSDAAKIELFRHVTIRKTTLDRNGRATEWNREAAPHRTQKRKIRKTTVKRPFRH